MSKFIICLLLPVCTAAQLNVSQDLVAKGIAASNLTPNTPSLDAKPLLEAAVAWAAKNGICTLTADPGRYYLPSAPVMLNGAANLTIDFRSSDLYYSAGAFECQNCNSVVFQNFSPDALQLPFTQVSVTTVDSLNRKLTFQVSQGWRAPTEFTDDVRMFVFRNGAPLPQVGRLEAAKPITGATIQVSNNGPSGCRTWRAETSLATTSAATA